MTTSKTLLHIAIGLALSVSSIQTSYATTSNEGTRMHVQISNETNAVCQLMSKVLDHGRYDSAPPQSIMAHDSKTFDIEQVTVFYGPDVTLAYTCDNVGSVTFEAEQTSSYIIGHTPYITVIQSQGLTLDPTDDAQSSSMIWHSAGILNVTIRAA